MTQLTAEDLGRAAQRGFDSAYPGELTRWENLVSITQDDWINSALASPLFDVLRRCQERLCNQTCAHFIRNDTGERWDNHNEECSEARAVLALREKP